MLLPCSFFLYTFFLESRQTSQCPAEHEVSDFFFFFVRFKKHRPVGHYLVGHKGRDGKAGIIAHTVVIAESQGEQPLRHVVLGHHLLVLCPSKQGEVGQGLGAASQDMVVGAAATPAQNHIQASQADHLLRDQDV